MPVDCSSCQGIDLTGRSAVEPPFPLSHMSSFQVHETLARPLAPHTGQQPLTVNSCFLPPWLSIPAKNTISARRAFQQQWAKNSECHTCNRSSQVRNRMDKLKSQMEAFLLISDHTVISLQETLPSLGQRWASTYRRTTGVIRSAAPGAHKFPTCKWTGWVGGTTQEISPKSVKIFSSSSPRGRREATRIKPQASLTL